MKEKVSEDRKFEEIYSSSEMNNQDIPCNGSVVWKTVEPKIPCCNCGTPTSFIDINFEAYVCSEKCEEILWIEYYLALEKCKKMSDPLYCNPSETVNTYANFPGDPGSFDSTVEGYYDLSARPYIPKKEKTTKDFLANFPRFPERESRVLLTSERQIVWFLVFCILLSIFACPASMALIIISSPMWKGN